MKPAEWTGIATWIEARWTHGWPEEAEAAFIEELEPYSVPIILEAGKRLLNNGLPYMALSPLIRMCREVRAEFRDWSVQELPSADGSMPWADVAASLGTELSFAEYALGLSEPLDE